MFWFWFFLVCNKAQLLKKVMH